MFTATATQWIVLQASKYWWDNESLEFIHSYTRAAFFYRKWHCVASDIATNPPRAHVQQLGKSIDDRNFASQTSEAETKTMNLTNCVSIQWLCLAWKIIIAFRCLKVWQEILANLWYRRTLSGHEIQNLWWCNPIGSPHVHARVSKYRDTIKHHDIMKKAHSVPALKVLRVLFEALSGE